MLTAEKIKQLSDAYFAQIVSVRRHLHQHPELSFKEYNTSAFLCEALKAAGIEYTAGYVKTGIVAHIRGKNPSKKTVLLRADMDALPIQEKNEVPYCSTVPGVMHACGHDVHSACALGAAFILNDLKDTWEGTVKIMFQPGEEVLPGGAGLMIAEGVLENPRVDKALALHVFPSLSAGHVGFKSGMYMASTDELYITVNGKGGHAAMPADYVNPIIIASQLLLAIEERYMQPGALEGTPGEHIPTVLAFGKITGMGATNVIPQKVELAGTFRTMNEDWRNSVHAQLEALVKEISDRHGIASELRIEKGYPFLVNDEAFTTRCRARAAQYLGENCVHELPLRMTAEDFAFISQQVPSCFFRLGTAGKNGEHTSGVHTPTFNIDESALKTGMETMAWLCINELQDT